jgi:secretion/DNA translocation related CpaE-like protein
MEHPLIVTADPQILDQLLRIAATAGVEVNVARDAGTARRHMPTAPLVIVVDDALADALAREPAVHRPGVVLVGKDEQLDTETAAIWGRATALGAEHVAFLPEAEPWLAARLASSLHVRGNGAVVGVIGGRGGAGATTLAVALAVTAARRGLQTMLIDADPLGGGIDLVVGAEHIEGLRWPDLAAATSRVAAESLRQVLPSAAGLSVLSWDRGEMLEIPPITMSAALTAARTSSELVVVDLPRHIEDAARIALRAATASLLVVPAEVRASASAARVASSLIGHASDLRVVVRGPAPGGLDGRHVSEALGLRLAGELRPEPGLALALERGEPPARGGRGPLASFCDAFLADVLCLDHRAA